jgi:hypothetical protein
MFDLPRKLLEYYCINCGERFWMEKPSQAGLNATPLQSSEGRSQELSLGPVPFRLVILNN